MTVPGRSASVYHLAEYVIDLAQLIDALGDERVILIGHSLGSMISSLYAGARPDRVERLVAIEGIDPPRRFADAFRKIEPREWLRRAIDDAQRQAGRLPRRYASIDAAAARACRRPMGS